MKIAQIKCAVVFNLPFKVCGTFVVLWVRGVGQLIKSSIYCYTCCFFFSLVLLVAVFVNNLCIKCIAQG